MFQMSFLIPNVWSVYLIWLTNLIEEFVAFVKYKNLQVLHWHVLAIAEGKDTTRCADDDVGSVQTFEQLDLTVHWLATVDHLCAEVLHELSEANDFILDLVGQFAGVAQNEGAAWLGVIRDGLED